MYKHTNKTKVIHQRDSYSEQRPNNNNTLISFGDSFSEHIRYLHIMHHKSTICITFKY